MRHVNVNSPLQFLRVLALFLATEGSDGVGIDLCDIWEPEEVHKDQQRFLRLGKYNYYKCKCEVSRVIECNLRITQYYACIVQIVCEIYHGTYCHYW